LNPFLRQLSHLLDQFFLQCFKMFYDADGEAVRRKADEEKKKNLKSVQWARRIQCFSVGVNKPCISQQKPLVQVQHQQLLFLLSRLGCLTSQLSCKTMRLT
jgi:hypothetical protein